MNCLNVINSYTKSTTKHGIKAGFNYHYGYVCQMIIPLKPFLFQKKKKKKIEVARKPLHDFG
jgi:hypothetical protein